MKQEINIQQIDRNLAVETKIEESDIRFYDVRQAPFELYGFYNPLTEPDFKRLPDKVAESVNEGVARLYLNTAGGRVRFSSDSAYVAIHAEMPSIGRMPHFALTGSAGFDLFVDDPESGISRFFRPFCPDNGIDGGYESILRFGSRRLRHFTIHFPTYSSVKNLHIGLQADATVGEGMKYRNIAPIVYYGSSITQGGCTSRPGNIYQSIISRRLGVDYLNLGFSGSARGEQEIADYMATLEMSAFVSDYDHNAPTAEHLKNTHERLYHTIREKHPDIPYIMISAVDFDGHYGQKVARREVVLETYRHAREAGDRNVYLIDGQGVFRGDYRDMCTVDGCHPNDLGFALMADAIGDELKRGMTQALMDEV